jgi:hypothetical protein
MNLYEKKKSKKDKKSGKVEFIQTGSDVTYTNAGEANSKERKAAIKHMLKHFTGRKSIERDLERRRQEALGESLIVDYLISEEFASSEKSAEAIMQHMSEEWLEHILYESSKGEKYAAALRKLRKSIEDGEKEAQARLNPTQEKKYVPTKRVTKISNVRIG